MSRLRTVFLVLTVVARAQIYAQAVEPTVTLKQLASGTRFNATLPKVLFYNQERLVAFTKNVLSGAGLAKPVLGELTADGAIQVLPMIHARYRYYREMAMRTQAKDAKALVISIDGDTVLILTKPGETITRYILSGKDPTDLTSLGCAGELLYFDDHFDAKLVAFLRVKRGQEPRACHKAAATRLGESSIVTFIRHDSWFFGAGTSFPVVYPFTREPVPVYADWIKTITSMCDHNGSCGEQRSSMEE